MGSNKISVSDANFKTEVLESAVPVLVDFFATWCGPCRMQTPILEELAKKMGDKVEIKKIDVDQHMDLAEKYGIRVVPTLVIEKDGKVV